MRSRKFTTEGNLPLFPTDSNWKAPSLSDLPDWSRADRMSIDTEFRDPTLVKLGCGARRNSQLAGISFMLEGGIAYYVPLRHPEGNVENPDKAFEYFHDMAKSYKGKLIGANITGDLDIMHYEKGGGIDGIRFNFDYIQVLDVLIIDPLIWELHRSYSLASVGDRRGIPGKDKLLLKKAAQDYGYDVSKKGWEKSIPDLPAKFVGPYAEHDAAVLFPILADQWVQINKQKLEDIIDLEMSLLPLLLKMRQRGVALDFDQLERVEQMAAEDEHRLVAEIKHATGVDIGFNGCMSASRVAPALKARGIKVPLTESGQPSITTEILANIDDPVGKQIRALRQANKIRTTFCESLKRYQTGGRLHPTYRQIVGSNDKNESSGAAFGRLSSCSPNIQQQPSRGRYAKPWRSIFIPDGGGQWLSADYSAVEPRWTVALSSRINLASVAPLAEEYRTNPRIDPHSAMAKLAYGPDFTEEDRKKSKTMVLGTTYGMGGAKLCKVHLKVPTRWLVQVDRENFYFDTRAEALNFRVTQHGRCKIREVAGVEGQAIQDQFHEGAPFLKEFVRKVIDKVEATGFLKILGGRIIHFPIEPDGSYGWSFKAPNRLVQGTAGMHLKIAMLAIEKEFPGFLQMTIHDEVCGTCPDLKTAKMIGLLMEQAVRTTVPFRTELEWGKNWGSQSVVCCAPGCTNMADPKDKFGCAELHSLKAMGHV